MFDLVHAPDNLGVIMKGMIRCCGDVRGIPENTQMSIQYVEMHRTYSACDTQGHKVQGAVVVYSRIGFRV